MVKYKYKVGDKVKILGIADIKDNDRIGYDDCAGTIATIVGLHTRREGNRVWYDCDVRGIGKCGGTYAWGAKFSWIVPLYADTESPNYPGNFKKVKVHRTMEADPKLQKTWKPIAQW